MMEHEYDVMRRVEDLHWWYAVLRWQVLRVLKRCLPAQGRVLDAGCGTGGMLALLLRRLSVSEVAGVDASELAVQHCSRRGLRCVRLGSVNELPFEDASFDGVLSLDVLYHSGVDEMRALAEMRRVLKPGGVLVVNLPAFAWLRGIHDDAVCGDRRYKACQLRLLLEGHSLRTEMIHYWNAWLFLPLLLWRRLGHFLAAQPDVESDLMLPPKWLNRLLVCGGKIDAWLCRTFRLPLGSSVFAVAIKEAATSGGQGT